MRLTLALIAIALLVPPAQAGWFSTTIHLAPYHVGDALSMRWSSDWTTKGQPKHASGTVVSSFEGPNHAADAFGIDRPTVDVRADTTVDGKPFGSEMCHLLQDGNRTARTDVLWGSNGFASSWRGPSDAQLGGLSRVQSNIQVTPESYFWGACGLYLVQGSTFTKGERYPVHDIMASWDFSGLPSVALSAPAQETTFHGRTALRLTWPLESLRWDNDGDRGTLTVILADGLPGVVSGETSEVDVKDSVTSHYAHELVGYAAGFGSDAPLLHHAAPPSRDPQANFVPMRALDANDEALHLPYPFADALSDARNQLPKVAAWVEAHPEATIANAYYDRACRNTITGAESLILRAVEETDGCWWIHLGEGTAAASFGISRSHPAAASTLAPGAAPPRITAFSYEPMPVNAPTRSMLPADGIDAATLSKVAAREGAHVETLETFWLGTWRGGNSAMRYYAVGDVSMNTPDQNPGARSGKNVNVDAQSGGATNVYAIGKQTQQTSLLSAPNGGVGDDSKASALSALAGPAAGAGLAGGALAGVALLVLAIKFLLIPLFTRLRRDRLLDNPVRARLYDQVRAEPGIHQAELVDHAGIGEGATRYHLRQLTRNRLLMEMHDEGFVRYFAVGEVPPEVAHKAAALRNETSRAVYDLLVAEPDLSLRQAGSRLGMSAPSVHRAKKKLETAGLLPLKASR